MPLYEYECRKCSHIFEVRQAFTDDPISKCESCNGKVQKRFCPPAIIFKGSGWHCKDYQGSGKPKSTCPVEAGETDKCEKAGDDCKKSCAAS